MDPTSSSDSFFSLENILLLTGTTLGISAIIGGIIYFKKRNKTISCEELKDRYIELAQEAEFYGKYDIALDHYYFVFTILCNTDPESIAPIIDNIKLLSIKLGNCERIISILKQFPELPEPSHKVVYYVELAMAYLIMRDNKSLEHINKALTIIESNNLKNQQPDALIKEIKGDYYFSKKDYKEAENCYRKAIITSNSLNDNKLTQDTYLYYRDIQKIYIFNNQVDIALKIQDNEIKTNNSLSFDNFPYYWHLCYLSTIFISFGYDNYAEELLTNVIKTYESYYDEVTVTTTDITKQQTSILDILIFAYNTICVMYYNQNKMDLYKKNASKLEVYEIETISKYFTSVVIGVSFYPDDISKFRYFIELKKEEFHNTEYITSLDFLVQNPDENEPSHEQHIIFDNTKPFFIIGGREKNLIKKGKYKYIVQVNLNKDGEESKYYHVQHVTLAQSYPTI